MKTKKARLAQPTYSAWNWVFHLFVSDVWSVVVGKLEREPLQPRNGLAVSLLALGTPVEQLVGGA